MVALISFMSLLFQQITLLSGRFRGVDITYVTQEHVEIDISLRRPTAVNTVCNRGCSIVSISYRDRPMLEHV